MFEAISAFWTTMDAGLQRYVTSLAATLTADLLRKIGKKKGSEFEEALQEAYCEGLKHFLYTLRDERVDKEHLLGLLDKEDVRAMFVKSVTKPPSPQDEAGITAALQNTGIDTSTIRGFPAEGALRAFQEGFVAKAELSENLIPFLGLQYLKELVEGKRAPAPDLTGLKRTYFTYLREKYGALSFRGLSEGKTVSFLLKDLYINLSFLLKDLYTNLSFSEDQPERDQLTSIGRKHGRREALARERGEKGEVTPADILTTGYAVITGEPGSGKSTLLKYIAIAFVDGEQGKRLTVKDNLLPILLPIAAYAEGLRKATSPGLSLEGFIPVYYRSKNLPKLTPLFEDARGKGQALYLLDGLDEVTDEAERQRVAEAIRDLIMTDQDREGQHRTNRYLVTCRTASYTGVVRFERIADRDFLHCSVLPFDRGHTKSFLFKWYCCYEQEINRLVETCEAEARLKTDQMMAAIDADQNLADLATNPLMLTMLGLIEHEGGRLPENRAELYAKCLRMFSGLWDSLRSLHQRELQDYRLGGYRIDEDFIVNYLGPIAFRLHESAQPEIEAGELKKELAKRFRSREKEDLRARQLADELLGILREESGILRETGIGAYGFAHQTFREYLAARVLTDLDEDSVARLARLDDKLFKPEWQEVILLTAATLKQKAASQFIRRIYETSADQWKNLILAGKCAVDTGRERVDDALYDELITSMMRVIGGDDPPPVRAAVGETLGWLGDPRDLKGFVPVGGGRYNLSTGNVTIEAFELGRYPVTNAWFAEFVDTGGYRTQEYWTKEGLKWLKEEKQTHPRYWNDRNWRCPNTPVVGVTWYEADAFTKWLTATSKVGHHYRLPSEAEWEAAAAGKEGRVYPWGNEWASGRCNTSEAEIGKKSIVGIFRTGATPGGAPIFDMVGNVWEWTVSDYGKGGKVLRGGSWFYVRGLARCANRAGGGPDDWTSGIGFRCAKTVF
jgi:energy-coupling factor transporter ATP-binding protein EcfA2